MRTATEPQLQLGEIDIANIKINPRSRDDIPQLLRGLQYLYSDNVLREEIFQILEKLSPKKISTEMGRPSAPGAGESSQYHSTNVRPWFYG